MAAVAAATAAQTGMDGVGVQAPPAQTAADMLARTSGLPVSEHLLDWGQMSPFTGAVTESAAWPAPQMASSKPEWRERPNTCLATGGGCCTTLEECRRLSILSFDALTGVRRQRQWRHETGCDLRQPGGFSELDIDWQRLAGIPGLTSSHMIIVNRSGVNDSTLFGDHLLPVQEIYGAGGNVAAHLVSFYVQEKLFDGRLDLAAGRMNVENDFASSPLYCNYMNNVLCGDPKALPGGDIGHSAYPDGVWGGRVRVRPTSDTYVAVGVYEVSQGLYGNDWRSGFEFDGAQDSGVYVPVEAGYEPRLGASQLPGHYKIGFGYDSSNTFTDFSAALHPGVPAPTHTGNTQLWLLADQMLLRQGPGDQDGIIALGGYVHANNPAKLGVC